MRTATEIKVSKETAKRFENILFAPQLPRLYGRLRKDGKVDRRYKNSFLYLHELMKEMSGIL